MQFAKAVETNKRLRVIIAIRQKDLPTSIARKNSPGIAPPQVLLGEPAQNRLKRNENGVIGNCGTLHSPGTATGYPERVVGDSEVIHPSVKSPTVRLAGYGVQTKCRRITPRKSASNPLLSNSDLALRAHPGVDDLDSAVLEVTRISSRYRRMPRGTPTR